MMTFQYENSPPTVFGQQGGADKPADARADDDDVIAARCREPFVGSADAHYRAPLVQMVRVVLPRHARACTDGKQGRVRAGGAVVTGNDERIATRT
jgi:hypothetical protein